MGFSWIQKQAICWISFSRWRFMSSPRKRANPPLRMFTLNNRSLRSLEERFCRHLQGQGWWVQERNCFNQKMILFKTCNETRPWTHRELKRRSFKMKGSMRWLMHLLAMTARTPLEAATSEHLQCMLTRYEMPQKTWRPLNWYQTVQHKWPSHRIPWCET